MLANAGTTHENEGVDMSSKHPRKARVLDIDPDGKTAEIEFVEEHDELVIADYVLTGRSEATAAEEAGAEIDPTPGRHPPLPDGPETIELPHRNPRNARVLRIDPDGKTLICSAVNCTCASVPTAIASSADRSQRRASAACHCFRWW